MSGNIWKDWQIYLHKTEKGVWVMLMNHKKERACLNCPKSEKQGGLKLGSGGL